MVDEGVVGNVEAHGDSLMPQPGSHRRNACGPRARHGGVTLLRRAGSSAGARVPAAVTQRRPCCVQIGYKGRFAFFRAATEPRNHAVSFRPFHSGKVLCIRFGHRARCRGSFGHRAPPLPDAQPRPNLGQTPNISLTGGGSASRPHPVLCGRGHSTRPGAARTGRGHPTPPGPEIRSPDA